ncbi:DRMBL-domain-containing protein [Choiromyces venosus 120613-1]|uniref:DRMBL-domain-containing protein n=1 Tax=Choiromyces venosus 120613-1 TaxID=1336337 RepID=A0A3N4KA77_9PEZI|nr:DRMBL-domain-containing protein [Choiromyces venosus 120613-1]
MIQSFRRKSPYQFWSVAPQRVRLIDFSTRETLQNSIHKSRRRLVVIATTTTTTTTSTQHTMQEPPKGSPAGASRRQFSLSQLSVSGSQSSSPSSAKKQKTFHTPGSAKPKQTLLKPHQSILNSSKKSQSPFSSSQGVKGKAGKNSSILSFFKPVSVDAEAKDAGSSDNRLAGKKPVEAGAKNDDLFIKHGGYNLDVSDPEDEDEGDSWSQERKIIDRPDFIDERSEVEKDSPTRFGVQEALKEEESSSQGTMEYEEGVVLKEAIDTEECTPPPLQDRTPVHAALPETLPPKPNIPPGTIFDPGSLKLDRGRSMLFSKKGSTPSPFRGLGKRPFASINSSDAPDDGSFVEDTNDLAWKLMLEKKVSYTSEDKGSRFIGETSTEIHEFLPNGSRKDDYILIDDSESTENFEEVGFEENEDRYPFDPVSGAIEQGFQGLDDLTPEEIQMIMEPDRNRNRDISRDMEIIHCPICAIGITNLSEQDANVHVNGCIDGKPLPLPVPTPIVQAPLVSPFFSKGPAHISKISESPSAFTKIMSRNVESQAWASATKSEMEPRAKRGVPKPCPFYKVLFGGSITVDAFKYGSVPGCQAYFLSHFHSDHYIGLTSKWDHGPIWCSRATANLVRMKLRVDPQYVREFPFEEWTDVVDGIRVRGLDANHCPGSMLFLFEQDWAGRPGKQRILHCGDFRASAKHLNHPLLRPGKDGAKGQRLDSVYLDTTYLNPKYAFPSQKSVIKACEELCVALDKESIDGRRGAFAKETSLKNGMGKFVQGSEGGGKGRGKLLVVVGTYSIGKEKVCLGIAKALGSKIFAPRDKIRICRCLEDEELDSRLTSDPKEAQVHMTPLMRIDVDTLQDYLNKLKPHFSRIVALRPSGWSYRPPSNRLTDSPSVSNVLHSASWKGEYKLSEMCPERGSTRETKCYSVPYSEHSSFRELTMFCCALNIGKIIPTVNIGSEPSRDRMNRWFEKWEAEKRKNGLFKLEDGES